MTDKNTVLDESLKQVNGGKLADNAKPKIDNLIKRAKNSGMDREELKRQLPGLLVDLRISDGNNLSEDVMRVSMYIDYYWDRA